MLMKNILLVYVIYFVGGVLTVSDEEAKMRFIKLAMSCTGEYPVSADEILSLQQYKIPASGNGKCLLACACRKLGAINDKGMFDTGNGIKIGKNLYGAEGGKSDKAKDLVDTCKGVNDEPVTDGEKGCDRAALLFKCIVKNAKKASIIE